LANPVLSLHRALELYSEICIEIYVEMYLEL
jgi:hypothetical protein